MEIVINEKQKIPRTHCRNSSKSNKRNRKNRHKMDTPNTQIHDRLLSCLGTGISIKSCGVRLVLWDQTSSLSEIMRSCNCFPKCK